MFELTYRLVLRIRCDAKVSQCPLGEKYGCNPDTEATDLIALSKSLGLTVSVLLLLLLLYLFAKSNEFEIFRMNFDVFFNCFYSRI